METLIAQLKQHKAVLIFGVAALVLVLVLATKARSTTGTAVQSAPTYVGSGTSQSTGTANAGDTSTSDSNTTAIQALSATNDLNFKYAQELAGLTNANNTAAANLQLSTAEKASQIQQSNLAFTTKNAIANATATENLRESGLTFDTGNVYKGSLNAVAVQSATDAETLQAQKNNFNWLYGGSAASAQSQAVQQGGTVGTVPGGSPASVLFAFQQAPLVAQQQRDIQTAAANTANQINIANDNNANQITASIQNTTNTIAVNAATTQNTIGINAANTANTMQINTQQNNFQDHINNVNQRAKQTNSILGIVGNVLGGLF